MAKLHRLFLTDMFGRGKGMELERNMDEMIGIRMKNHNTESKVRQKLIQTTILPSIVLYDLFQKNGISKAESYTYIKRFLHEYHGMNSKKFYIKISKIPLFFSLFRKIFSLGLNGGAYKISFEENNKKRFDFTIHKCLWHEIYAYYKNPEICEIFCDVDDISFSGLANKLRFSRTNTLGKGGTNCDFHFRSLEKK